MDVLNKKSIPIQRIKSDLLEEKSVELYIKREDLIHPVISGNKWRKLKYNLKAAAEQQENTLLTFGGAYSNHIAAVAVAGNQFGFKTIGIIRGERQNKLNDTLRLAVKSGMDLYYLSREEYRKKSSEVYIKQLRAQFGSFYLVPEGGSNKEGVLGCTEIADNIPFDFDYICCACGTGATLAGVAASIKPRQKAIGFPVLKGAGFLKEDITRFISEVLENDNFTPLYQEGQGCVIERKHFSEFPEKTFNWSLNLDYHFGGYAKYKQELIDFIRQFKKEQNIQLDPIYTGKLLYGIYDLIKKDYFPRESTIVAIHTGGLQGIKGFEKRFGIKL